MLASAGFPHGVNFDLVFPAGEAEFQSAATIMQNELAPAGFHMPITQIPGGDLFTQVYEKKQGNAVLIENSSNGPDLANNFESSYESTGFVAVALGSVNASVTSLVQQASNSSVAIGAGSSHAEGVQASSWPRASRSPSPSSPRSWRTTRPAWGARSSPPSGSARPTWQASTSRNDLSPSSWRPVGRCSPSSHGDY